MMTAHLSDLLGRIKRLAFDRAGLAGVEFALLAPLMILLVFGSASIFDLTVKRQSLERSLNTTGDILSRMEEVDADTLTLLHELTAEMSGVAIADLRMQVTSVIAEDDEMRVDWQQPVGGTWSGAPFETLDLPDVPSGDSVAVLQVRAPYRSVFPIGDFEISDMQYSLFYRPRAVASLAYSE